MTRLRGVAARSTTGVLTVALVLLISVGAAARAGATLVHDELLQPGMYDRAFAENDVYRRIYTEVLTDPAVRGVTDDLLGGFTIEGTSLSETSALSIALVRLALPPTRLRDVGTQLTRDVLAYLRGETAELHADVDLSVLLGRLDATVTVALRQVLSRTATRILDDLPAYESAVRAFADDLANGEVPPAIPVVGGRAVSEDQIVGVINAVASLGMSAQVRDQVMAAVRSGDEREALIAASTLLARTHLQRLIDDLGRDGDLRIDMVDALGRAAGQPQRQAIEDLNSIRRSLGWAPSWAAGVGLICMLAGVAGLLWLHRRRPERAVLVVAVALVAASASTGAAWSVVAANFSSPLIAAAEQSPRSGMPATARTLLVDVDDSLRHELRASIARDVDALFVVGVGLGCVAVLPAVVSTLRRVRPAVLASSAAGGALLVGGLIVWRSPAPQADAVRRCNGHVELCDRPYNTVVQAATHNSMSSSDVVSIWPEHDGDIRAQLEAGIRTLLVDTKYWEAIDEPSDLSTFDQALPSDVSNLLFSVLGSRLEEHPGTYLCHSRCAYGAAPLPQSLATIRDFLDANPDEVVTLIIQNGITTADTEEAFEVSRLAEYVYDGSPEGDWPTLGELVESGQRLVVIAERAGPPPDWYHDGRRYLTDTSFTVTSPDDFVCSPQRGDPDAPLYLLNHWIRRQVPDRSDALIVNQRPFIVDRARRCEQITGRLPTFIAVEFYSLGDVVGAVDTLNGVGRR